MSLAGELLLKSLVRLKSRLRPQQVARTAVSWASYIQWQHDSSSRLFARFPDFDIRDKRVLEIGCGTGGRTAYLSTHGASAAIGIDINCDEIHVAREWCSKLYPSAHPRLTYLVSSENDTLNIGLFDVVVLVDCMEHVVSPLDMLGLAYAYTKPGGDCYFSSVGWYHYLGSHLDLIPFVNVLFSDETIINTERWRLSRPEYVPNRWDSDPPEKRWEGVTDLRNRPGEHLNKLTIHAMKKLLRQSPFALSKLTMVGFGPSHPALRPFDPLRHIPVVQEMYHSLAIAHFRR